MPVDGAWPPEVDTADDESLPRLESRVAALLGAPCVACGQTSCGHEALFNVALGLATKPRCASCLADGLAMTVAGLRDHLWAHFQRRACYGEVWRRVSEREGFSRTGLPACLWPDAGRAGVGELLAQATADSAPASSPPTAISVAEVWDAGGMGCGDLVLELRLRMDKLESGATLKLVARDPGAKEDLPAWCRLTGHKLLAQSHPEYWFQRKE